MKQNDQTGAYLTSADAGDSTYDTFFANGVSGICALSWTADSKFVAEERYTKC